jgi:hypothetical protein
MPVTFSRKEFWWNFILKTGHNKAWSDTFEPLTANQSYPFTSRPKQNLFIWLKYDRMNILNEGIPFNGINIYLRAVIAHSVWRWATVWTIGVLGFDFRRGLGIFLFTTASRTALGCTQPPIQWVPGALSLGVKRLRRGAVLPLPRYAFMVWCSVKKSTGTTLPLNIYLVFSERLYWRWECRHFTFIFWGFMLINNRL